MFCLSPKTGFSEEQKINTATKPFTLKLGATRLIYNEPSRGATLLIENPQDYPILAQSEVYAEDKESEAPFLVTPPLFRLDAQQQSRLRVVRTGGDFPKDREILQWLCVAGIPPKTDDAWAQDKDGKSQLPPKSVSLNVQISVRSCIKLFVRPDTVKGSPFDVASSLSWSRRGEQIIVNNPTPFYMNLASIKVGDKDVSDIDYVSPFSTKSFEFPKTSARNVEWKIITDNGGTSRAFSAVL